MFENFIFKNFQSYENFNGTVAEEFRCVNPISSTIEKEDGFDFENVSYSIWNLDHNQQDRNKIYL